MSDAPKKPSIDEMLTLAKKELADSQKVEITDPKVTKAAETLSAVLKETLTGSAEKIGITQERVTQLLSSVQTDLDNGRAADYVKADTKAAVLGSVAVNQEAVIDAAVKRAASADVAFGAKPGSYEQAIGDVAENAGQRIVVKTLPEAITTNAAIGDKVNTDATEAENLIKSVGQPKIDEMKTTATGFLNGKELKDAVDLRSAHVEQFTAAQTAEKAGTKMSEDTKKAIQAAEDAAAKAEKEANTLFGKLRGANAAGDAQKAYDRVMAAAIDNSRETNPQMHEQLQKIRASGVKTQMGEMGEALAKDRFAAKGIQTELAASLGAVAASGSGMGKGARIAVGIGGAVVAGLAAKAALSDKPADPQTGEKPKMSFMGKITTALAAVVGVAMIATAVRNGSPSQGWKDAAAADKNIVGKFTAAVQSAVKHGPYSGRA